MMTLQWTLVATFLYCEITLIILLLLPFIPATLWQRVFKSKFFQAIASKANVYFSILTALLVLCFLDSIREMHKYSGSLYEHDKDHHLGAIVQTQLKLFRAQRNYYIAGFALFLQFVIRRLIMLILSLAALCDENKKAMLQAQCATEKAEKLLKEKSDQLQQAESLHQIKKTAEPEFEEKLKGELEESVSSAEKDLSQAKADLNATKDKAESVSKQYDELLKEHHDFQERYRRLLGNTPDKKDD